MSTRSWKRGRFAYAATPSCGQTVPGKGFYCCNKTLGNHFTVDRAACCASDPFASPASCPGSLGATVPTALSRSQQVGGCYEPDPFCRQDCANVMNAGPGDALGDILNAIGFVPCALGKTVKGCRCPGGGGGNAPPGAVAPGVIQGTPQDVSNVFSHILDPIKNTINTAFCQSIGIQPPPPFECWELLAIPFGALILFMILKK